MKLANRIIHPRYSILLTLSIGSFLCGTLHAQRGFAQPFLSRDIGQSVFVRDSTVVAGEFARADRMQRLLEWDKAAEVYQQVLKNYPDRVWPGPTDKDNRVVQYTSMTLEVQKRLAKWPQEGIDAYRTRYETEAAALLEAAHDDLGRLNSILTNYLQTDAARTAGMHMMDQYLERGDFSAAAWTGDELLDLHRTLGNERPKLLYRTALAHQLGGNPTEAQTRLKELQEKFPQSSATVRGSEVVLAESLGQELQSPDTKLKQSLPDSWPMAFGSPDRGRVPQAGSFGGARLFGIDLQRPTLRTASQDLRRQLESAYESDLPSGKMTGIFPAIDRGEMFFQDNARVYAVSLESGQPLPGWAGTYDGDRNGRYILPGAVPMPRSQQCTVTLTDDLVLAVMNQIDLIAMNLTQTFGVRDTKLVCLDRTTGQQRWIVGPKQFPEEAAGLRNLDLAGSPLVVGDTVYVQARGGKGMQFEDSYVVSFDLNSGKFKWACYIASANSGVALWNSGIDAGAVFQQNISHLAYAGGRIYAQTNVGAIASINAYDGTIVWLNLYPRDSRETNPYVGGMVRGGFNRPRQINTGATVKPWTCNPVIVSQGKVFVLPSDGLNVHIYDMGNGTEFKRIPTQAYDMADTMLGIVDDKLLINSDQQVFCIDWAHYDPLRKSADGKPEASLFWRTAELQRAGFGTGSAIRGRGFVMSDSVIIPTAWQLFRLSMNSGKIMEAYPTGQAATWTEDEGPGNVIVTQDRVVVAGPVTASSGSMRVNVYTDLAMATAKLDAAVAAAPENPEPRLRYAEIMFAAGKLDIAVAKLDEAIAIIGGNSAMRTGPTRDRVFNTALTFAQKMAKETRPEAQELVAGLFDRAGAAASTASQKVNYRITRAIFVKQPDQEVKLYQQILSDADMRNVSVSDADGESIPASQFARTQIDKVIVKAGQAVYAPYERAAAEMLTAASKTINADQLQNVASVYPNSTVAPRALLSAADVYETANNPRAATQVLRQAYFRYPNTADSHRILESMARNYLLTPNRMDVAIARLQQAAVDPVTRQSPKLTRPLVLPNGNKLENMTFAQAAAALKQLTSEATTRDLPDVFLPPSPGRQVSAFKPEPPESIIPNVAMLLVPPQEFTRNDRIVTLTPGSGIRAFSVGSTQPLFSSNAITEIAPTSSFPPGAAWIGLNLLVWTESEATYLAEDGRPIWKISLKNLPDLEVVAQNADVTRPRAGARDAAPPQAQGGVLIINGRAIQVPQGRPFNIQAGGGIVQIGGVPLPQAPAPRPANEQIAQLRILNDRAILGTTEGRLVAIAMDGGKILWQSRMGTGGATHLVANDDFIVARLLDESGASVQLVIFDAATGRVITRQLYGEAGTPLLPTNIALSPDGMLICLMPDSIVGKDLFEPGGLDRPTYQFRRAGDSSFPYQNSTSPDHLQISQDRFIAVGMDNSNANNVRVHSLRTGDPILFRQTDTLMRIDPSSSGSFMVRTVGPKIYIATQKEMRGIDLERGTMYPSSIDAQIVNVRDLIVAREHVLAITEPAGAATQRPRAFMRVKAFSRAILERGQESGRLDQDVLLNNPSTIVRWQAVNGGLYYLAGDQKLHFLRGAK